MASVENPLLQDFTFPPFDVIEPHHISPGIQSLLIKLEDDLVELEKIVQPTWPKLVVPLEKITDRLYGIWGLVYHLQTVKDSPELRAAVKEIQPKKVDFELRLSQSKPIYEAFKAIRDSSDWQNLSDAHKRVVELRLRDVHLNGVSLEDAKRQRFNEIEQELEKLSQKFQENILDSRKVFERVITDKKELEGLPLTALTIAADNAISKGHEKATAENGPWLITFGQTSGYVSTHACNRSLREEVCRATMARASNEPFNNTPIIERILELRLEKAKLLGLNNYAEVSFKSKMATMDQVKDLLGELRKAAWVPAVQDMEELQQFARGQGAEEADNLMHWDINFWCERLRESKYDLNEEELRPYFSLPNVMKGLFNLTKKLYGIDIEPADGMAPVWHKDVSFYKVKDSSNNPIAYFYVDPYSRPLEKQGGAWMGSFIGRSCVVLSNDSNCPRLPIVRIVCNQSPPTGDKPSLMTLSEVQTIFHEFGHALQHMLTKQDEGLVSGTKGIEKDAVEIASLFMEQWCYHRDTMLSFAKHYETGEALPEDACSRILSARTFRAGSHLLDQLRFTSVDLELHSSYMPGGPESVHDVDRRISKDFHPIPVFPEDRFLCCYKHIFAANYAAGYYSYQWAQVLAADAFSAFEEAGLDNDEYLRKMGSRFRETILAYGGGKAPSEVFLEFRGREPTPDAYLRYNGLLPKVAA